MTRDEAHALGLVEYAEILWNAGYRHNLRIERYYRGSQRLCIRAALPRMVFDTSRVLMVSRNRRKVETALVTLRLLAGNP